MTTFVYIIGDSEVNVWGLSGRERLQRMLKTYHEKITLVDDLGSIPDGEPVLFLCADHLFDARVLSALVRTQPNLVLDSNSDQVVAIHIADGNASNVLADFLGEGSGNAISVFPHYSLDDLNLEFQQKNLKKKDAPYVLFINRFNYKILESELFSGSYKGVTDLVTKWVWPAPASWVTHLCVRIGLSPNHVTLMSLVFAVLAGIAFWFGNYGTGLMMGWIMTFLDTVDGKLARVTVTSSRLGDVLDHGLDIIHPPLWYMAWGIGLSTVSISAPGVEVLIWLMFIGYIGGRICEGVFQFFVGSFDIFIWRKFDSFNRLITARRNPNLILLTGSWMINQPELGFLSVVVWHLISTAILAIRVVLGWRERQHHGSLKSWFEEIVPGQDNGELAVRIFTRTPVSINDRRITN
jgi:phosphatidylglycerophosphate synthase